MAVDRLEATLVWFGGMLLYLEQSKDNMSNVGEFRTPITRILCPVVEMESVADHSHTGRQVSEWRQSLS